MKRIIYILEEAIKNWKIYENSKINYDNELECNNKVAITFTILNETEKYKVTIKKII
jgi:hypothetical protein